MTPGIFFSIVFSFCGLALVISMAIHGRCRRAAGPGALNDPLSGFTHKELQSAALHLLSPLPDCDRSYIGGTVAGCDRALKQVEALRIKYAGYEPAVMRKEIMDWLDFAEQRALCKRKDCESQKTRNEQIAYREENRKHERRVGAVLRVLGHKP